MIHMETLHILEPDFLQLILLSNSPLGQEVDNSAELRDTFVQTKRIIAIIVIIMIVIIVNISSC